MYLLSLFMILNVSSPATAAPIPNHQFVNQENKPQQLYDFKGSPVFISFVYTRCPLPKMCPLTMTLTKQVWKKMKKELPNEKMKFLIVTLDPDADTPAMMKAYGKKWGLSGPDFVYLTGNSQVLSDFASEFNVIGFPTAEGTVSHNQKSILVSSDLTEVKQYKDNEWKADQVVSDYKKLIKK